MRGNLTNQINDVKTVLTRKAITMSKSTELLKSRRFWVAIVSAAAAVACFALGYVGPDRMASWLEIAFGIYAGSLGLENASAVFSGAAKAAVEAKGNHGPSPDAPAD
jgi:hypothetical protein